MSGRFAPRLGTGKERVASRGQGDIPGGAEGQDGSGDHFVLVEALSRPRYESSYLPGAISVPYEFVDDAEKVLPDERAEIVIYCINEECEASREEARELVEMGYVNVLHYAGRQAGLDQGRPPHRGRTPLRVREQTREQVPPRI